MALAAMVALTVMQAFVFAQDVKQNAALEREIGRFELAQIEAVLRNDVPALEKH